MGLTRRTLITGLVSLVAAPAIVRASSLMPVRVVPQLASSPDFLTFLTDEDAWQVATPLWPAIRTYFALDGVVKTEPIHWTELYRAP
jgi:hypothetical protein